MIRTENPKKTTLYVHLIGGVTALGLALFLQTTALAASGSPSGDATPLSHFAGSDTVHSIRINKAQTSKKHKIKLYPDARQQVLFFSANGQEGKVYQLFLFDMDGRLVNQAQIRNKETTVLTTIAEGNYLFEVFTDDERIENGQLTVH